MIQIADIILPESAVWENEINTGNPKSDVEICPDGTELIFTDGKVSEIDIYIPKIAGELTRETVLRLKELSENNQTIHMHINGEHKTVIFRHTDNGLELTPINQKQTQNANDSYYGYIKLLEV